MKTLITFACLALLITACPVFGDEKAKKPAEEKSAAVKTSPVKVRDITLQIPETWETSPNTNSLRLATFAVPAAEGDSEHGELTVFSFGQGSDVGSNLTRWIGQFSAEGREAKALKGKAGDNDYYLADISGTYNKPVGPPVLQKTKAAENYRMMGVILIVKNRGVYFLKLAGPDKTIKTQADAFRKSFGGDAKTEKEFEF
ncbi:hypothetical protein [Fuerstiella marisgermanici]|uniref:PsbP C-terminal domain-containing protein n=1 Tax=Fuerstiella marisgermanici TaxID=1891926 RepID=A0A1P8WID3_9PLAN|nr:hypothetical protein [Fuerstiella marisgermanici]APZ93803.1 hypothetical protein Fuma_03421 [Fuerstiella marisgermanici]